MENEVIIIGNDHVNTLGTIRIFGENNIKPFVYVISDTHLVAVAKSKYIKKCTICRDEEMAILYVLRDFETVNNKPILIATSDKVAAIIDANYDRLKKHFIVQNINGKEKSIIRYMDKYEQFKLFDKCKIASAKSQILLYPFEEKISINFPIIIKPLLSINGNKDDITIVHDITELDKSIIFFKKNNYSSLLVQEYLKYDYECDVTGYSYDGKAIISGYVKKLRVYPEKKGSTTFGIMNSPDKIKNEINKLKKVFSYLKYTGIFNVEFFVSNENFIINEINFRNSAIGYSYNNSNPTYYYYLSCKSKKLIIAPKISKSYYIMNELSDLHNVLSKKITFNKYKQDKHNCESKMIFSKDDIQPAIYMYVYKILDIVKIYKILSIFEKIYHSREETYLLKATNETFLFKTRNKDYKVVTIDDKNIELLNEDRSFNQKFIKDYKKGVQKALALISMDNEFIGKAVLKSRGADDAWVKIMSKDSFLISTLYIKPKFRGKKYQDDLIVELVKAFINLKKFKLYGIVYTYNIPSWKNLQHLGFSIVSNKTFKLKRFLKRSINKVKI